MTVTPYDRGRQAYRDGAAISVIPADLDNREYEDFRLGWEAEHERELAESFSVPKGKDRQ